MILPEDSEIYGDLDRTVCFCHNVSLRVLLETIRSGSITHEQVMSETCASTGCGGCESEVLDLLEQERLSREKARKTG